MTLSRESSPEPVAGPVSDAVPEALGDPIVTEEPDGGLSWDPPGPGVWEHDSTHQQVPFPRLVCALLPAPFTAGSAELTRRYGLPFDHFDVKAVNGWFYMRPVVAGVPDRAGSASEPPAPVMKLLFRLIPEMRRRNRAARRATAEKLWVRDAAAWAEERQAWAVRFRPHQHLDLAAVTDAVLADELETLADMLAEAYRRHFALMGMSMGLGRFVAQAPRWDVDAPALAELLKGHSPSSAAAGLRLRDAAHALRAAGVDVEAYATMEPGAALAAVRRASPAAAAIIDDHLAEYGYRMADVSFSSPLLAEDPGVLVRGLVQAGRDLRAGVDRYAPIDPAAVRSLVPEEHRASFDELLADAQRCYAATDDNTSSVYWCGGLLQRVVVECGRRLAASDHLADPEHVVDLEVPEILAALRGSRGGAAAATMRAAAAAHGARRRRMSREGWLPPTHLGGEPTPTPDLTVFPDAMRVVVEALMAVRDTKVATADPEARTGRVTSGGTTVARGHGVGAGTYTGRACIVATAEEAADRLEPGDVIVCPVTNPAFDPLFAIAGGVVTEAGGVLGHTAVMAREFGIPAVVGTGASSIVDGTQITVIATSA